MIVNDSVLLLLLLSLSFIIIGTRRNKTKLDLSILLKGELLVHSQEWTLLSLLLRLHSSMNEWLYYQSEYYQEVHIVFCVIQIWSKSVLNNTVYTTECSISWFTESKTQKRNPRINCPLQLLSIITYM